MSHRKNLIFLHGGPGFTNYLQPYFSDLEDQFNCVFYDQLQGRDVNLDKLVHQLDELVSVLSAPVVLVGHSWGGTLALEYSLKYQSKISGVVLMCTGLCEKHWGEDYRKELVRLGLENAPLEKIFLSEDEKELGIPLLEQSWKTFSEETFESLQSYLRAYDVRIKIGELKIPILNIFGEKDVRFPAHNAKNFKDFNRLIENFEVKGGGHFPFLTQARRGFIHQIFRQKL